MKRIKIFMVFLLMQILLLIFSAPLAHAYNVEDVEWEIVETSNLNPPISAYTTKSLSCTVAAGSTVMTVTPFTVSEGDIIDFDLKYSPSTLTTSELQIALYNTETKAVIPLSHKNGALKGIYNVVAARSGTYKLRIKNSSSEAATISGTYTPAYFSTSQNIALYSQEKSNWCWATCIQMCSNHYGYTKTQTQIVTAAKGSAVNETGTNNDYKKSMEYATDENYTASRSVSTLTISQLKSKVSNNLSPIIGFARYSSGTLKGRHANVVTAVDDENVYMIDLQYKCNR